MVMIMTVSVIIMIMIILSYFITNKKRYEAVCGGDLDMETGQLESPNFPEDYQVNFI